MLLGFECINHIISEVAQCICSRLHIFSVALHCLRDLTLTGLQLPSGPARFSQEACHEK